MMGRRITTCLLSVVVVPLLASTAATPLQDEASSASSIPLEEGLRGSHAASQQAVEFDFQMQQERQLWGFSGGWSWSNLYFSLGPHIPDECIPCEDVSGYHCPDCTKLKLPHVACWCNGCDGSKVPNHCKNGNSGNGNGGQSDNSGYDKSSQEAADFSDSSNSGGSWWQNIAGGSDSSGSGSGSDSSNEQGSGNSGSEAATGSDIEAQSASRAFSAWLYILGGGLCAGIIGAVVLRKRQMASDDADMDQGTISGSVARRMNLMASGAAVPPVISTSAMATSPSSPTTSAGGQTDFISLNDGARGRMEQTTPGANGVEVDGPSSRPSSYKVSHYAI